MKVLPLDQLRGLRGADYERARHVLRNACGLYFLWFGPRLMYIGRSVNIGYRVQKHDLVDEKGFTHVTWLPVDRQDHVEVERAYIHRYWPPYNRRDW